MPKFRLRGGKYRNAGGDGKTYRKGAVVESPYQLDVKFQNKFIPVPDSTPVGPADGDPVKIPLNQDRTFQIGGEEFTAPPDLSDSELQEWEAAMEEKRAKHEGKKKESSEEGAKAGTQEEDAGEDVSSDFPTAAKADLIVTKKGKHYFVADKDKPGEPLNSEPMTNKRSVAEFIAEQSADSTPAE